MKECFTQWGTWSGEEFPKEVMMGLSVGRTQEGDSEEVRTCRKFWRNAIT